MEKIRPRFQNQQLSTNRQNICHMGDYVGDPCSCATYIVFKDVHKRFLEKLVKYNQTNTTFWELIYT